MVRVLTVQTYRRMGFDLRGSTGVRVNSDGPGFDGIPTTCYCECECMPTRWLKARHRLTTIHMAQN